MKLITIPEIAEKHNADESQLRKTIKALKIATQRVFRKATKKSATAINEADLPKLFKGMTSLKVKLANDTDVPVSQVAQDMAKVRGTKPDISSVLKKCESLGIKLTEAKIGNRPVKVLSKKDYAKFMASVKNVA
jgi:hypothetical protein